MFDYKDKLINLSLKQQNNTTSTILAGILDAAGWKLGSTLITILLVQTIMAHEIRQEQDVLFCGKW